MNKFLGLFRNGGAAGTASRNRPRGGLGRLALQISTVIAAACVLLLAVRVVLAAPTYAGPISVTANMDNFSPSVVAVNSPATAGLSAYYTPPSGTPEGQLSASYDWSVSQVQYKAAQADTFGSPPASSYTTSISPAQPSASSGATLTFTPLITGYWQVSTSCSVTVTDTTTNQYWTGSDGAGPEDLISATLTIQPTTGTSVFLNTKNYVVVTVAPADLAPDTTLNITGGATFTGGVTTETMSSATEDVYFYGQNVYGSGGSEGSGQISATVSPPSLNTQSSVAMGSRATAAGAAGGGGLDVSLNYNSYFFSHPVVAVYKAAAQALANSVASYIMPNLESNTNGYLLNLENTGTYSQQQAAAQEYAYLNPPSGSGYGDLSANISTAFNNLATGSALASTPPATDVLDTGVAPSLTPWLQGFPGSAVQTATVTPTYSLALNYPVISPNGTWQPPKVGDLVASAGVNVTGPINFGDIAQGYWKGSLSVSMAPGTNFQVQGGTVTANAGLYVHPFNSKDTYLGAGAMATFTPPNQSLKNLSAAFGVVFIRSF